MKKYAAALLFSLLLCLTGCSSDHSGNGKQEISSAVPSAEAFPDQEGENSMTENKEAVLTIRIGDTVFEAETEDNETARAFLDLCPMETEMNELNGNEKYVYLKEQLPSAAVSPGTVQAGDLMLFGNSCVVLFYETFQTSYTYTKIGHLKDTDGLKETLGSGNVLISFSTEN